MDLRDIADQIIATMDQKERNSYAIDSLVYEMGKMSEDELTEFIDEMTV